MLALNAIGKWPNCATGEKHLPVVDGTGYQGLCGLYSSYIDKFGKWSRGRFFRVNAACTANSHTQDYVLCHSTCTKLQYMKHNIKIYKTSMIFITIAIYYECCKSGRKKGEWGGKLPLIP